MLKVSGAHLRQAMRRYILGCATQTSSAQIYTWVLQAMRTFMLEFAPQTRQAQIHTWVCTTDKQCVGPYLDGYHRQAKRRSELVCAPQPRNAQIQTWVRTIDKQYVDLNFDAHQRQATRRSELVCAPQTNNAQIKTWVYAIDNQREEKLSKNYWRTNSLQKSCRNEFIMHKCNAKYVLSPTNMTSNDGHFFSPFCSF